MRMLYWGVFLGCAVFVSGFEAAAAKANYDTAWTFLYDAGYDTANGYAKNDAFRGVAVTDEGVAWCAGVANGASMVMKIDAEGKQLSHKVLSTDNSQKTYFNRHTLQSICLAKNGDLIAGGERFGSPWIVRLDTLFNVKWSKWYYDSIDDESMLLGRGYINSVCETSWGKIACAGGDKYPDNGGSGLNNYMFYFEYDSLGNYTTTGELKNRAGYTVGGFSIAEAPGGGMVLVAGNEAVICIDSSGKILWERSYSVMIEGVGTMSSRVNCVKQLRDGRLMVAGATYEWNCWERYKKLYKDAWWTPIGIGGGGQTSWDTAGVSGKNDRILDFVQLRSGNIAFTGTKSASPDSGVWVFVTDSTGKEILWEKQFDMPGLDTNGFRRKSILPYAVAATPDSGFTVVGYLSHDAGNEDAIAMHFLPAPVVQTTQKKVISKDLSVVRLRKNNSSVYFCSDCNYTSAEIFDARGRVLAVVHRTGRLLVWDFSGFAHGVYGYRLSGPRGRVTGKVTLY